MKLRSALAASALALVGIGLAGCTAPEPPRPSETQRPSLQPTAPDGAWLDDAYAAGFGEPVVVDGSFCAASADGTIVVTETLGTQAVAIGWDTASGHERWRAPGGCRDIWFDADSYLARAADDRFVRRPIANGAPDASWPNPVPDVRLYVAGVVDGRVVLTGRSSDDGGFADRVVDSSTGQVLWTAETPAGKEKAHCTLDAAGTFAVCGADPAVGDPWVEVRDQRSGAVLAGPLDMSRARVALLADGFAIAKPGGEATLFDAVGAEIGTSPSLPGLTLPANARISTADAKAWAGIVAVAADGSPALVETESMRVTTASGAELDGDPVSLSASGEVIAVRKNRTTVALIDGDGKRIGRPYDVQGDPTMSVDAVGGLLFVSVLDDTETTTSVLQPRR